MSIKLKRGDGTIKSIEMYNGEISINIPVGANSKFTIRDLSIAGESSVMSTILTTLTVESDDGDNSVLELALPDQTRHLFMFGNNDMGNNCVDLMSRIVDLEIASSINGANKLSLKEKQK